MARPTSAGLGNPDSHGPGGAVEAGAVERDPLRLVVGLLAALAGPLHPGVVRGGHPRVGGAGAPAAEGRHVLGDAALVRDDVGQRQAPAGRRALADQAGEQQHDEGAL